MENSLTYTMNGDYQIPDLKLTEQPEKPLGKYGRMRKAYLKEHRPLIYNQLLLTEKLYPHLIEIDETAQSRLEQMMPQLAKDAGATEQLKTSSAFSFAQADIDHVLRLGGNTYRQRERIVAAFEEQKSTTEIADTLKTLYHGGNGIGSITAWYAEDGIHLSHGKTARYDKSAQVISWESAAERIGQLLQDGQFATNVELAEAAGYERSLLAEKFWNSARKPEKLGICPSFPTIRGAVSRRNLHGSPNS